LQGGILLLGRDAGVTLFHASKFETSNLKHSSPLFTSLPAEFHNPPFMKRSNAMGFGPHYPNIILLLEHYVALLRQTGREDEAAALEARAG